MKNTSASLRLTIWFTGLFLCGFVLMGALLWIDLWYSLSQGRDRTLVRRATRIVEMLQRTKNAPSQEREAEFEQLAGAIPEGNLIQVFGLNGRRLLPLMAPSPDFPWPKFRDASEQFVSFKVQGRPFRALQYPAPAQPVSIRVGGQLDDNRNMMMRLTFGLAASIPVMLALSAVGGYFMGRRLLRPVEEITASLHSINIGNLSQRLPVTATRDEFHHLAETCNEMLARLQSAVERINRFTADASHELRSPVALIRGVAEYALRNPATDEESREAFGEILAESLDAGQLIEDMLTLARADGGYGPEVFTPVELTEVVSEVCGRLRQLADAKQQTITARGPGEAWITGDRSSIRRLVSILLDNAIKYTPRGGNIEVSVQAAGTVAAVTVKDDGIGIPVELLPRIFDRFARADPSRGEVSGSGLGLAIAKWIAEVHRADLRVESRAQRGSVFRVEFRATQAPVIAPSVRL